MMCIRDGALSPSVFTGLKRRLDDLENAAKPFKPPSVVSFLPLKRVRLSYNIDLKQNKYSL